MFIKYKDKYNPKIDFKVIYELNPYLDYRINYYEVVDIFKRDYEYVSLQGEWFKKLKDAYFLLFKSNDITKELLLDISNILESKTKEEKLNKIMTRYFELRNRDKVNLSLYLFKNIILENVFYETSKIIAVFILNTTLKKEGYVPIIFKENDINWLEKIIKKQIPLSDLYDLLSIFKGQSTAYNKEYEPLTKKEIIKIINENKEELVNKYKVKKVWLYGSFVREQANEYSDIDMFVDVIEDELISKQELIDYFKKLLKRNIDLKIESLIDKSYYVNGMRERELILYDNK